MTEQIERPKLGTLCLLEATAVKHKRWSPARTEWERQPWTKAPNELVMYIGCRTVFDGNRIWISDEQGYGFKPESHRTVWLFITDERRNQIYAFPEDVHIMHEPNYET